MYMFRRPSVGSPASGSSMSIGITGARGFIGSYLTKLLLAEKSGDLRLFFRSLPGVEAVEGAEVVVGDLQSRVDCERFAADLHVIYHLAHTNTPVNSDYDQPNDALVNLVPLLNLLGAIKNLGTKPHLVYFSSGGAVYARQRDRIPYCESDACSPVSSYGIQKLAAEHYLRLAAHKGYLTATILRVGNGYGTLLPHHRLQGLIGIAINDVLHGRPVRVFGSLDNVRDYVHLDDICSMAELAARPREPFTIVNAGSGQGHSVREVLGMIGECHGSKLEIQADGTHGQWLPDWVVLDSAKAGREFGWRPRVELRSGIAGMFRARREEIRAGIVTA